MKRLNVLIGMTALTAVVGMSAGTAQAALSPEPARSAPAAEGARSQDKLRLPIGHGVDDRTIRHNLERRSITASPDVFEQLITSAVKKNDPHATPGDIERIIAALTDIGEIIASVEAGDISRVTKGIAEASAAVAEFQATGNPDALRRVLCGSGNAAAGSIAILSDVVRMYEASANLPQIPEILNMLDPRTPEGAELFASLPEFAQTPEVKAALISLSDIGRTLNKIDKHKVIGLARDWAEAAAKCDVRTLLELPRLMMRTFELGREIVGILFDVNRGDVGAILAPQRAARVPAIR